MLPVLSENMPMKYWLVIFNVCCRYNPAVAVPPGWPVLRPQSWFPQHPAGPLGLAQQPLFPIQNVTPPLPSATLQPLFQTRGGRMWGLWWATARGIFFKIFFYPCY